MRKNYPAIMAALVLVGAACASGSTSAQSTGERQAACELSAIRDARSLLAIQLIRSSCNWLALNADSLLNEANSRYHACVVQNLSGVQADAAAQAIIQACRASNPL